MRQPCALHGSNAPGLQWRCSSAEGRCSVPMRRRAPSPCVPPAPPPQPSSVRLRDTPRCGRDYRTLHSRSASRLCYRGHRQSLPARGEHQVGPRGPKIRRYSLCRVRQRYPRPSDRRLCESGRISTRYAYSHGQCRHALLKVSTETFPSEDAHARSAPSSCGAQETEFTLAVCSVCSLTLDQPRPDSSRQMRALPSYDALARMCPNFGCAQATCHTGPV
jgi:hypothetical protein